MGENYLRQFKEGNNWCLSKLIFLNVQNNLLIVKKLYVDVVLFCTVLRIAIVHQLNLCCLKHWKYITNLY